MFETLQIQRYHLQQFADHLVSLQLDHLSPISIAIVFFAGLMTSLTPCMLSMLPITIGYIGGYEADNRGQAAIQSLWFALGLATTLAGLGIVAALMGKVYGQVGMGLPIIVSLVAILMGLEFTRTDSLAVPINWRN